MSRIERSAAAVRWRLGLTPYDRLDPYALAAHLGARVLVPEDFVDDVLARRLRHVAWDGMSFRVPGEPGLVVVLNPARPPARRTATLLEELAHVLLEHRPTRLTDGSRTYDAAQEREAFAFGAALLLPRDLLAREVRARRRAADIARRHRCSEAFVLYRLRRLGLGRRYDAYTLAA
jgi:Zn-dependent peptidase ImmA (M78 family)